MAVLTFANLRGITRTAALARILVALSIVALGVIVGAILFSGNASNDGFAGLGSLEPGGVHGLLQSAALLFFAFAGYARIPTSSVAIRA